MSDETQPPEPMEVRPSLFKLIRITILGVPLIFASLFIFVRELIWEDLASATNDWGNFGFIITSALVPPFFSWALYNNWTKYGARRVFLKLSPEGLVVPSLGSSQPIPWNDVKPFYAASGLPIGPGLVLKLNIDPAVHISRPYSIFSPKKNNTCNLIVSDVFNVEAGDLKSTTIDYQRWYKAQIEKGQNPAHSAAIAKPD